MGMTIIMVIDFFDSFYKTYSPDSLNLQKGLLKTFNGLIGLNFFAS
jgi:hypothetical protein